MAFESCVLAASTSRASFESGAVAPKLKSDTTNSAKIKAPTKWWSFRNMHPFQRIRSRPAGRADERLASIAAKLLAAIISRYFAKTEAPLSLCGLKGPTVAAPHRQVGHSRPGLFS